MLKTKSKFESNDIFTIKLANGDELVAKLISETEDAYIVTNPAAVVPTQSGVRLVPALFTVEAGKEVPISKNHIMMTGPTLDELKSHYIEKTTGIQPVTKGSIII
jgi:hypothetical protein